MKTSYKVCIGYCGLALILIFQYHEAIPMSLQSSDDVLNSRSEKPLFLPIQNPNNHSILHTLTSPYIDPSTEPTTFTEFDDIGVIETSQDHTVSLRRFILDPSMNPNQKWVAYFWEEAIAVVKQAEPYTMLDCNVIEVREEKLQVNALRALGRLMELVPLQIEKMVPLITLCGSLHPLLVHATSHVAPSMITGTSRMPPISSQNRNVFGSLVLPGTLWCGMKDRADSYERLGNEVETDRCCRAHDHCPIKVSMFETRYGTSNFGFGTRSHCLCEIEFYNCLKKLDAQTASAIGDFYFNVLNLECLVKEESKTETEAEASPLKENSHPYQCTGWDQQHRCKTWKKRRKFAPKFRKTTLKYKF